MVGGTGSLSIPNKPFETAVDSPDFWLAYFQQAADSDAYLGYAQARFPKFALMLHRYRDIQSRPKNDEVNEEDRQFLDKMVRFSKSRVKESYFIIACRASLLFFEGNTAFNWTFLSPSPGFKPGPKTGKWVIGEDAVLPVDGSQDAPWEGRLLGITITDICAAIGNECEMRMMAGRHRTLWTPKEDAVDIPMKEIYGHLSELEGK